MKNRFYGDKKDYIKYGLLDVLSSEYKSIGINWYLTDDRHGNQRHGNDLGYLSDAAWSHCNPRIYPLLKERVNNNERAVKYCRLDAVLRVDHEVLEQLPDNAVQEEYRELRDKWHYKAKKRLAGCDLIFFDPDIGVKNQLPVEPVKASEYSASTEINEYDWCDWLAIQFLQPRSRFDQLSTNQVVISAQRMNKKVVAFIVSSVAFLYVTNSIKLRLLHHISKRWDSKICTQIIIP